MVALSVHVSLASFGAHNVVQIDVLSPDLANGRFHHFCRLRIDPGSIPVPGSRSS